MFEKDSVFTESVLGGIIVALFVVFICCTITMLWFMHNRQKYNYIREKRYEIRRGQERLEDEIQQLKSKMVE
jgi:hypothetical protein